jgi:D-arabinose 1-dehydrogenase-like Zn-dependent alcohol dehydrogenase
MRCIAIAEWGQPLAELDRQTPVPQGAEAVVRITACGLCHSDLHIHDGWFDMGGGAKLELPSAMLPLVLGHEPEGVVEALGPEAAARNPGVKVGDRVAVYPWIGCGKCASCVRGAQEICVGENRGLGTRLDGGFASHMLVPDADALIPAGDLALGAAGSAMCSGLTAIGAIEKVTGGPKGEPLMLIGLGGVGLMGLAVGKALYDGPIIAVDVDPGKREAALARGAAEAIDPRAPGAIEGVLARTGGVYAAIDFVGSESSFGFAMGAVRRGGKVIVVGLYGGAATIPLPTIPMRAITVQGSYVGSIEQARRLIGLLRDGTVSALPIATRPLFGGADAAMAALKKGEVIGRIALTP